MFSLFHSLTSREGLENRKNVKSERNVVVIIVSRSRWRLDGEDGSHCTVVGGCHGRLGREAVGTTSERVEMGGKMIKWEVKYLKKWVQPQIARG